MVYNRDIHFRGTITLLPTRVGNYPDPLFGFVYFHKGKIMAKTDCFLVALLIVSVACVLGFLCFSIASYNTQHDENQTQIKLAEEATLEARFSQPVVIDMQEFINSNEEKYNVSGL